MNQCNASISSLLVNVAPILIPSGLSPVLFDESLVRNLIFQPKAVALTFTIVYNRIHEYRQCQLLLLLASLRGLVVVVVVVVVAVFETLMQLSCVDTRNYREGCRYDEEMITEVMCRAKKLSGQKGFWSLLHGENGQPISTWASNRTDNIGHNDCIGIRF